MRGMQDVGLDAEAWLASCLRERFGDAAVRCIHEGADLVLHVAEQAVHIEVKHLEGRYIHWSGHQVEMARVSAPYYMAVLRPGDEDDYDVFWVWRPMDALARCRVEVRHRSFTEWRETLNWEAGVPVDDEWLPATNGFRVEMLPAQLAGLAEHDGADALAPLMRRIEAFSTAAE